MHKNGSNELWHGSLERVHRKAVGDEKKKRKKPGLNETVKLQGDTSRILML